MSTKKEKKDDCKGKDYCTNSAREKKVIDFACFLNKRDTAHSKKKNNRRSEVLSNTKKKLLKAKIESLEEKDVYLNKEDYIPIQFVRNLFIKNDTVKKKQMPLNSKMSLNLMNINLHSNNQFNIFTEANSLIKFANFKSKFKLTESLSLSKNSSNIHSTYINLSNYVKDYLTKYLNLDMYSALNLERISKINPLFSSKK